MKSARKLRMRISTFILWPLIYDSLGVTFITRANVSIYTKLRGFFFPFLFSFILQKMWHSTLWYLKHLSGFLWSWWDIILWAWLSLSVGSVYSKGSHFVNLTPPEVYATSWISSWKLRCLQDSSRTESFGKVGWKVSFIIKVSLCI